MARAQSTATRWIKQCATSHSNQRHQDHGHRCHIPAVSRLPGTVTFLLMMLRVDPTIFQIFFHVNQLLPQLYMCIKFIYATKFDPAVKQVLLRMIPCKKTSEVRNKLLRKPTGPVELSIRLQNVIDETQDTKTLIL